MVAKIAVAAVMAVGMAAMSVQQGRQQAAAMRFEEEQAKRNAETQRLNADIDESERRRQLGTVLSQARAQAATRGYDLENSGSFQAIQAETTRTAEFDMRTSRLNWLQSAETWQLRAANARMNAQAANMGGWIKAGVSLAQFGANAYMSGALGTSSAGANVTNSLVTAGRGPTFKV